MGRKMPFMDGHYLKCALARLAPSTKEASFNQATSPETLVADAVVANPQSVDPTTRSGPKF